MAMHETQTKRETHTNTYTDTHTHRDIVAFLLNKLPRDDDVAVLQPTAAAAVTAAAS